VDLEGSLSDATMAAAGPKAVAAGAAAAAAAAAPLFWQLPSRGPWDPFLLAVADDWWEVLSPPSGTRPSPASPREKQ